MTATKGAGNATVTYNGNALTAYVNSVDLQNVVAELEATVLSSTAEASDPGLTNSVLRLEGDFHPTLDGYLGPDSLSGAKRTVAVAFTAGGSTVTWTWTASGAVGGFITNYNPGAGAKDKLKWTAQLRLSGLGVRSVA